MFLYVLSQALFLHVLLGERVKPSLHLFHGPRIGEPQCTTTNTSCKTRLLRSRGGFSATGAMKGSRWRLMWRANRVNCWNSFRRRRVGCMIGHPRFGWSQCCQDVSIVDEKIVWSHSLRTPRERTLIGYSCCWLKCWVAAPSNSSNISASTPIAIE